MQLLNQTELSQPQEKLTLYGVTWKEYDTLVTLFMDRFPGLRMTFLEGTLEIMGTSSEHERLKKIIARLLEMYAVEKRVIFNGYGNTTFRKEAAERGLEPDECYCLGELKEVLDIAIEIALSSGETPRRRKRADPAPPAGARECCPSKGTLTKRVVVLISYLFIKDWV